MSSCGWMFLCTFRLPLTDHRFQGLYASDLFFLLGHCAAKVSVILLLRRLSRKREYNRACSIAIGIVVAWGLVAVLIIALKCDLSRPWQITSQCADVVSAFPLLPSFSSFFSSLKLISGQYRKCDGKYWQLSTSSLRR